MSRDLAAMIDQFSKNLVLRERREVGAFKIFCESIAPALHERCMMVSCTAGVLIIRVRDAATRFQVDRMLRTGLLTRLRRDCGISRVRLVI